MLLYMDFQRMILIIGILNDIQCLMEYERSFPVCSSFRYLFASLYISMLNLAI